MKENIEHQLVRMPLSNDDDSIECVGVVDNIPIGVEIIKTPSGGYDVNKFIYDHRFGFWMAVGDAEKVHNFASAEEARRCGIVELLPDVQCFLGLTR